MIINCYFDGGYNKEKNGYGSFRIEYESWEGYPIVIMSTEEYPNVETNNEAEYEALIRLLSFLDGLLPNLSWEERNIIINGDSKLTINQTLGVWKVSASNLMKYRKRASSQLDLIRFTPNVYVSLNWVDREQIVAKLGH